MTEKEIKVLLNAAKKAGLNPSKLQPRNPWTLQGPVAESLQLSLTSVDPELSQQWQKEAGVGLSLAAIAVQKGLEPLSAETLAEFQEKAPADLIEAQKAREADIQRGYEEAAAATAARLASQSNPTREQLVAQEQARLESIRRGRAVFGINPVGGA